MRVNWDRAYKDLREVFPSIRKRVDQYLAEHALYEGHANVSNYPPEIILEFYVLTADGRQSEMYQDGKSYRAEMPDRVKVEISEFIVFLQEQTGLKAKHEWFKESKGCLLYSLRPNYDDYKG